MLTNLKKLSSAEVKLQNTKILCESMATQALAWMPTIQESLSKLTHLDCSLEFARSSIESKPEITGSLLAITWPPKAGLIWIESDTKTLQTCAYHAISSTLTPEDPQLSDLETGIVRYLISQALGSTKQSFEFSDTSELPQAPSLCLSFKFTVGDLNSYIRLWISQELLDPQTPEKALEIGKTRCLLSEFPFRIALGKVNLTQEEFKNLEAGDIIVLENSSFQSVEAFIGDPTFTTLKGSLSTDDTTGRYSLSIQELS